MEESIMIFAIKKYLKEFNCTHKNANKIGWVRSICAILGGLFISYFGLIIILKVIFDASKDALIIPLLFNSFTWPCVTIWIFLSRSSKVVFLRTFIPSIFIGMVLIFIIG